MNGCDIIATLIELLAEQELLKIEYDVGGENDEAV